ncbi:hypothetical protein ACRWW4_22700, partial [Escherichia coli]
DVFAGKKLAQIREILISESTWEEMTCLFAPSLRSLSLTHSENLPLTIPFFLVQDLLPSLIYSLSPPTHEAEYGSVIRTHSLFFLENLRLP